jgi:hypothetical protein
VAARTIAKVTDRFSSGATKLGYNRAGQALFVLIPALAGAGLGWALTAALDWLLSLSWIPFRGPLNLIDSVPDQIALPVLIGLGLVAGIVFGLYALHEELSAGARPMLSMRARALKEKKAADAADLRAELINLGVVVRDEGGKQYWRRTDRAVES